MYISIHTHAHIGIYICTAAQFKIRSNRIRRQILKILINEQSNQCYQKQKQLVIKLKKKRIFSQGKKEVMVMD